MKMKAEFNMKEFKNEIKIPVEVKVKGLKLFVIRLTILRIIIKPIFKLLQKIFWVEFDFGNLITERSLK